MSFGKIGKIATSMSSEEFVYDIKDGDSIVSFDLSEMISFQSKLIDKEIVETESYISLTVGEPRTNTNNWHIHVSDDQYIFTIFDGYVKASDLKVGDILKQIDGITTEIKVISKIESEQVQYKLTSESENFYVNGILFKS